MTSGIDSLSRKGITHFCLRNLGLFISFLILCVAYIRGVFITTAWSDDYPIMMQEDHDINTPLIDGRPLFALLQYLSFSFVDKNPENLFVLRAISLATLLCLFLVLNNFLGVKSRSAQILIALGFCLPSFQWFIYWATIWSWSIPLLLSTLAWMLWKNDSNHQLLAVFMLACAFLIYPLNSLLPFSLLAIKATYNRTEVRKLWKEFMGGLKLYGIGICLSSIVVLTVFRISTTTPSGKVSTFVSPSEILNKLNWWVTRPFAIAFRPFMIDSPTAAVAFFTVIPVFLVTFVGLYHQSRKMNENPFLRIITIISLAAIPISPLLIVSQNQIDFRLLASWNLAIFLIFALFIISWLKENRIIRLSIISLAVSLVLIQSNQNFNRTFKVPFSQKNSFLISSLQNCDLNAETIVISPKKPWPSLPLIGNFSTVSDLAHPWVLESNLTLIKQQISPKLSSQTRLIYQLEDSVNNSDKRHCIINLDRFISSISG